MKLTATLAALVTVALVLVLYALNWGRLHIQEGKPSMAKEYLDRAGRSALHYAAADGNLAETIRLIQAGYDTNLRDAGDRTPLHFAAQQQHTAIVKVLLEAGVRMEEKDEHGNTPLWTAVYYFRGDGGAIRLLRQWGADPYAKNRSGVAPIEVAREDANPELAKFFDDLPK